MVYGISISERGECLLLGLPHTYRGGFIWAASTAGAATWRSRTVPARTLRQEKTDSAVRSVEERLNAVWFCFLNCQCIGTYALI